ncbi:MAG TPA: hypothetical protein VJH22_00355 [Candidatus Nanoarchaeia archaeon]|nr:hypothetical protein [Candidatus Nanoarchaeia archaeon]
MKSLPLILLVLALSGASASATTLEGKVYDFSLSPVDKAVVEINTTPVQRTVTENGAYLLEVKGGDYTLTAKSISQGVTFAQAQEQVLLPSEGRFTLDIILFPEIMEDVEPVIQPEEDIKDIFERPADEYFFIYRALFIIAVAFAAWGGYVWYQRKNAKEHEEENDEPVASKDLNTLLAIIKNNDGRITQKDLRKELPYSEAKVSLMLDELESQDKVKRIKKGRGNIIVLR